MEFLKKTKYEIFIGLNDMQSFKEELTCDEIMEFVVKFFEREKVGFSVSFLNGAYQYENREFVSERTLALNMIDADESFVRRVGGALKMLLNQENIIISKSELEVVYV